MSFYENNSETWSNQSRQASWEQPGRQAAMTPQQSQQAEPHAFAAQFEEIERATDNLSRSGKWFPGAVPPMTPAASRRDSMPGQNLQRAPSANSDFDGRAGPSGLQNYYQGQRFPPRQSEAEQMLHAKRRMAAQRERELRNYHQEQQYNRSESEPARFGANADHSGSSTTSAKPDRSSSPNTMSEEDRRDLIARQHRALYGDNSSLYTPDGPQSRATSQDVRSRGAASPLAFDQYSQAQPGADGNVQMPPRGRAESTASPVGGQQNQQGLDAQRAATTSPSGNSPPQQGGKGVAPIGTRPGAQMSGLNKRATTPLTPSSLGYSYSSESQGAGSSNANKDDRSTSASSNPPHGGDKGVSPLGGSAWGSNSGVWGKSTLNSQASVWG